jgi:uncharacterized protein YbaP (TraB family)
MTDTPSACIACHHGTAMPQKSFVVLLIAALSLVSSPLVGAEPVPTPQTADGNEEVLVSGERPGPPLWKVRHGDNTLYILATISPTPKNLQWRSREVEAVLDRATAFVDTTSTTIGANIKKIGYLKAMGMALEFQRLLKNPDGKRLEDVLPADLNARFMALKARYAPKDRSMLKRRPVFAAEELWRAAVAQGELNAANGISGTIYQMALTRNIKQSFVSVTMDDPLAARAALDEFERIPIEAEIACMRSVLARFDTDLATARERAVAWAEGDVDALRTGARSATRDACLDSFADTMQVAAKARDARWQRLVEAVENHAVSLAVVDIDALLQPGGFADRLRARGYEVDEP